MAGAFSEDRDKNEQTWEQLLAAMGNEAVVPFLGAGACYPHLPTGGQLAEKLADDFHYPMNDRWDLLRVAQYAAVTREAMYVKSKVVAALAAKTPPALQAGGAAPDEPHRVLAEFPLPLYVTTNYDLFMYEALRARRDRKPILELCRWNPLLQQLPSKLNDPTFQMHPATPVVYHLHGLLYMPGADGPKNKPESLVLTEDDYLQFGEEMLKNSAGLIPPAVANCLRLASLLFIGYRLADWNFRLLLRSLKDYIQADNYLVIKPPEGQTAQAVRKYLEEYYQALRIRVYWGTAQAFAGELMERRKP